MRIRQCASLFLILISLAVFCVGTISNNDIALSIAIIILMSAIIINVKTNITNNIVFISFMFMLFYFVALTPVCIGLGISDYSFTIKYVNQYLTLILNVIYVSILFCYLAYAVCMRRNRKNVFDYKLENNSVYKRAYHVAVPLYIIAALTKACVSVIKLAFSYSVSYATYHAEVQYALNSVPSIILKIASAYDILFFIILATFPEPKKLKWFFICDIGISAILLLTGGRSDIARSIVIMFVYLIIYSANKNINTKKIFKICLLLLPLLIVFFTAYQYMRVQTSVSDKSILSLFIDGIIGNESSQMIAHAEYSKDILPRTGLYSFGDMRAWFINSILGKLFGLTSLSSHTVETAQAGVVLGQTVAYYVMPDTYLSGAAFGSCYIAELYADLGYLGVAIGNSIFGVILASINSLFNKSLAKRVIYFLMLSTIIYAPRAGFSSIFTSVFSFINIFIALVFYVILTSLSKNDRYISLQKGETDDTPN